MAAAPPALGKRESDLGSTMTHDESETQIATIMHDMMAAQKIVSGKTQRAACCWSEEDPKIEVARRRLEQGGIALFIRQQHASARRKRPPLRIWIPQKIRRSWSKFQSRGYAFVSYETVEQANAAITNLHNMTVDSRTLRVELARADKEAASGAKPY